MPGNRIDAAFKRVRAEGNAALMPFITAGDPDIATTAALIEEIAKRGADLLELGIPYSDPVADGPTIQASYVRALSKGLKLPQIFEMIKSVRARCQIPILTMISYSIVSRITPEAYIAQAAAAGVDGIIIPDLPADEGRDIAALAEHAGIHPVFLVAPTTPAERMKKIAAASRGFIYYISVTGTTGARTELPPDLADHIAKLKEATKKPVAVGFGISRPEQVASVAKIADGVIVGSAIVRKIHELADRAQKEDLDPSSIITGAADFVATLAAAKRKQ